MIKRPLRGIAKKDTIPENINFWVILVLSGAKIQQINLIWNCWKFGYFCGILLLKNLFCVVTKGKWIRRGTGWRNKWVVGKFSHKIVYQNPGHFVYRCCVINCCLSQIDFVTFCSIVKNINLGLYLEIKGFQRFLTANNCQVKC